MDVSPGEKSVRFQIDRLREKLRGVGGKYLNPSEKIVEVDSTIRAIDRIHRDQRDQDQKDPFFSTVEFKRIRNGLEEIRSAGGQNGRGKSQ